MLERILILRRIFTTRARDYSPGIGRFDSMDELGGAQQGTKVKVAHMVLSVLMFVMVI